MTTLFFGQQMSVVLPEVISEALFTYGLFDEAVTWMAMQSVRPGDVVFDVGAHFGYVSLLCAHLAGPRGTVYAFEPTPSTFEILEENARRVSNIYPYRSAVGDTSGAATITDYGLRYCAWNTLSSQSRLPRSSKVPVSTRVTVPIVRLDDFVEERRVRPTFVKVDAEDFELEVVCGLQQTVRGCRPVILLESGSHGALAAGELLLRKGYQAWVSEEPGRLEGWHGSLGEANYRFKDILFRPAS